MKIDISNYEKKKLTVANKKVDRASFFDFFQPGLNDKVKSRLYRELKVLLKSGITIEDGLAILIEQTKSKKLRDILNIVYLELLKGKTLVFSMSKIKSFTSFEINTLSIGEQTNTLPRVLQELEVFFERKYKLKNQIITVLSYPAFVIIITIAVLVFMLRNVVPMFEKVFKQFNSELPGLTRKIIYLSNNFSYFSTAVILILISAILFHYKYKSNDKYRFVTSSFVLRIPFFGRIVKVIYMSRFCRALNLLLSSKVSIVDSLSFVEAMIEFYPIENSIPKIKEDIIKGYSLGESLKKYNIYDINLVSMVKVSEKVSELDDMFNYLTEQYTDEVDTKSKRIGALIEPFIIIIIGSLVGVIMISMYLPMFDLSKILNSN